MVWHLVADFWCTGDHECPTEVLCLLWGGLIACDVAVPARIEECSAVVKSTCDHETALRYIVASSRPYRHRSNFSGTESEIITYIWQSIFSKCGRIRSVDKRKCHKSRLRFNPSNAKLNPICHLLALLGARHILHVSRVRVNVASGQYDSRGRHPGRGDNRQSTNTVRSDYTRSSSGRKSAVQRHSENFQHRTKSVISFFSSALHKCEISEFFF